ncbi:MAG: hypothetical protein VST70_01325 [Nitrospirota bacterium]|nr:hypothetical protein [Nitrospirota bacterium]
MWRWKAQGATGIPFLLEEDFTALLVNAAHITNMPVGAEEGDCSSGPFDPLLQSSHALPTEALS